MRYILDGCDGTGKTTKANLLAKEYKCDILHLTSWSDKRYGSYIRRLNCFDDVIFDRSFISEYVYSKVFDRYSEIDDHALESLIWSAKKLDYHIIIFTCDPSEIRDRLHIRNDECDDIINNIEKLNSLYVDVAKKYNLTVFDTSVRRKNEII